MSYRIWAPVVETTVSSVRQNLVDHVTIAFQAAPMVLVLVAPTATFSNRPSEETDVSGGASGSSSRTRILLLPVQDGTGSERVFRWYSQSFRRPGDELLILAVVEPTLRLRELQEGGVSSNDPLVEAAMMDGRSIVRRFLHWAHELNLPCRGLVQLDISPGFRIVRTARERGVHNILMGPRARVSGDFERQEFDSVTDYSVTTMSSPSIEESRKIRRILFPIDDSESCTSAFKWYLDYIKLTGDFITFVHVVEPIYTSSEMRVDMESPQVRFEEVPKTVEDVMNRSKAMGLNYMSLAKKADVESRAFLHVDTQPGRAILTSAKNHNVNMIVMESGGQGTLSGVCLGRVADYVVHNSTVPVVIVHSKKD
ncbi:hypothetical protein TcWFU_005623 [Taenia crassiceps]|uniref:UspA domain-containing protein n=1 Tax=Taenia crassiceps TaxID=6207 RepID=A0ABR4QQV4_9CEST